MINAEPGWYARYATGPRDGSPGPDGGYEKPVIAWSASGDAMVLDRIRGTLVRAISGFPKLTFQSIIFRPAKSPYCGVVPGDGWILRFRGGGEVSRDVSVVAFGIRPGGDVDILVPGTKGVEIATVSGEWQKLLYLPSP